MNEMAERSEANAPYLCTANISSWVLRENTGSIRQSAVAINRQPHDTNIQNKKIDGLRWLAVD